MSAGETPRRSVSADSFRKLTALLKKPVPPTAVAALAPFIPDIVVQTMPQALEPERQTAPAPQVAIENEDLKQEPPTEVLAPPEPVVEEATPFVIASEPEAEPVTAALPDSEPEELPLPAAYDAAKAKRSHLSRKAIDDFAQDSAFIAPAKLTPMTAEQEAEKAELARSLLDMMAAGGGQPQERALAADTLLRMLPQLPARTRLTLAQRLTIMDAPPPFLVSRLITDPDQNIAAPLLEECSHISDEDLFAIIQTDNVAKCRMLARRRKISPPIAEALAKVEDISVLLTLVRNPGAEISPEGFSALCAKASTTSDLLAPLCTRADLPVHFAFELFWSAPAQLRRYLFSRFLTDSENLTKILKITMGSEADATNASQPMNLEAIGQALESVMYGADDTAVHALAAAAKVNTATVHRILADTQGEPLMALLKVVGVPRSELEKALPQMSLGIKPLIDPGRSVDEVQAVFDQLSFNKARIVLTYWNWAATRTGPNAPQH